MAHDRVSQITDPEGSKSWRLTRAATFALIGLGAVAWLVFDQVRAARQQALPKTGLSVQGTVLDLETRRGGQILYLSYSFRADGAVHEIRDRRVGDFDGLRKQGPITVWYRPTDPSICVTENELHHSRFGATPFLFGGVIVLMMGLAAVQAFKVIQPRREDE